MYIVSSLAPRTTSGSARRTASRFFCSLVAFAVAYFVLAPVTASSQTTPIAVAWDGNTDGVTTGYLLEYGTSSGQLDRSYDSGAQTSAQLTLDGGAVYYFTVRAYDATGQMGAASSEVSADLRHSTPEPGTPPVDGVPTAQITATRQNAGTALVSWSTTNAVSASINGVAVALSGSGSMPVSSTTTFRLLATAANNAMIDAFASVTSEQARLAGQMVAAPADGGGVQLMWTTSGAVRAEINGVDVPLSGSLALPDDGVTVYRLLATAADGAMIDAFASAPARSGAALTARITAVPIDTQTVMLTWSTTAAARAEINGADVPLTGTLSVPANGAGSYRLLATSATGAMVDAVATVAVAPQTLAARIDAVAVDTNTARVTWSTTGAVKAEIQGVEVAPSGTALMEARDGAVFRLLVTAETGAMLDAFASVERQ